MARTATDNLVSLLARTGWMAQRGATFRAPEARYTLVDPKTEGLVGWVDENMEVHRFMR